MLSTWVKNVYSLCVEGVVNSARSYTALLQTTARALYVGAKASVFTHFVDTFPPDYSTANFAYITDATRPFYTVSTAPIIKKMNKK